MNDENNAKQDPRNRILGIAIRLFAERGLDAVSVRDITREAQVNLGAVNYYFGSKEQLIHEVFETLLVPVQRKRLACLERIEAEAGDGPLDLELVLRALIEPTIRDSISEQGSQIYLPRLMFQAHAVRRPSLDDKISQQSDREAKHFIDAFARAAPDIPYEEICWRYYFIIGGLFMMATDAKGAQRLRRLSDGLCDTDDPDRVIEELIAFYLLSMTAPAPQTKSPAAAPRKRSTPPQSRAKTKKKTVSV